MGQKKKLEAGLDDLFSQRSHRDSDSPARVTPDPEAASEAIEEHSDTSAIPSKASVDVEVIRVEDKDPGQRDIPSTDVAPVESDLEDVDIETEIEDADADAEIVEEVITKRPEKIVKQAVDPPVEFEDEGSQQRQLVIFTITGEDYGLDVQIVDSIIKRQPITAVPNTPDYVEGVINLRGEVLPVVDLRRRLGLPLQEFTKDTRIIVAELPGAKVGLLVDTMVEVLLVPQQAIQPPSPLISTVETAFISGIVNVGAFETGKVDERLIVLLNLENVLSIRRQ